MPCTEQPALGSAEMANNLLHLALGGQTFLYYSQTTITSSGNLATLEPETTLPYSAIAYYHSRLTGHSRLVSHFNPQP